MKNQEELQSLKSLLIASALSCCQSFLTYETDITIKGLLEIIIDKKHTIAVKFDESIEGPDQDKTFDPTKDSNKTSAEKSLEPVDNNDNQAEISVDQQSVKTNSFQQPSGSTIDHHDHHDVSNCDRNINQEEDDDNDDNDDNASGLPDNDDIADVDSDDSTGVPADIHIADDNSDRDDANFLPADDDSDRDDAIGLPDNDHIADDDTGVPADDHIADAEREPEVLEKVNTNLAEDETEALLPDNDNTYSRPRSKRSSILAGISSKEHATETGSARDEHEAGTDKISIDQVHSLNKDLLLCEGITTTVSGKEAVKKCKLCSYKTPVSYALISHLAKHPAKDQQEFSCIDCSETFKQHNLLDVHYVSEHMHGLCCKTCMLTFTDAYKFQIDQQMHLLKSRETRMRYTCWKCENVYSHKTPFIGHTNSHKGIKPYKCKTCVRTFMFENNMKTHSKTCKYSQKPAKKTLCKVSGCDRSFLSEKSLEQHMIIVHVDKSYHKCDKCDKMFLKEAAYKKHILIHGGEGRFICRICKNSYGSENYLKYHIMLHENRKAPAITCATCQKTFTSKLGLKKHINRMHSLGHRRKTYKCGICHARFAEKTSYHNHILVHEDASLLVACKSCPKLFANEHKLGLHMEISHESLSCENCSKTFITKLGLQKHVILKHLQQFKHTCQVCSKGFLGLAEYQTHLDIHKGVKNFTCDSCGKSFRVKAKYKSHLKYECGNPDLFCTKCNKTFTTRNGYHGHMEFKHMNISNYQCEICGKKFYRKISFDAHMTAHSGKRPFSCSLCDKNFPAKSGLNKHIKHIHSESTGSFKCNTCEKVYKTEQSFNKHKKLHKIEQDLTCECGKSFRNADKYEAHINSHTGAKPYACEVCEEAFSGKISLTHHKIQKHNILSTGKKLKKGN